MSFKRYIRIFYVLLMLLASGASDVWADGVSILVEKSDGSFATLTGSGGSVTGITGGSVAVGIDNRDITLTVTPESGYKTKKDLIVVEKMVTASVKRSKAPRRAPGIGTFELTSTTDGWITDATNYTFSIPADYDGAYVTVTFESTADNEITSLDEITDPAGNYVLIRDIDASGWSGFDFKDGENNPLPFSGTLDGGFHKIYNLGTPLFTTLTGTVKNVILEDVNISETGNVGAFAAQMTGTSDHIACIYNCGILSGSVSGTGNVGGLVGMLGQDGNTTATNNNCFARVINCYSYANITGGSVRAGIVGYNSYASKSGDIRTMVMNCMFYGDISSGGTIYPIYGGKEIKNEDTEKLNNYNYFRFDAPFSQNGLIGNTNYNRALAAEERYLVRFEFYRYLLNSNRELASWYVFGSVQTDAHTKMAKWVLDKSIAPYPILKVQGTYPSVVNYDPEYTNDVTGEKMLRTSVTERNKGKNLGTLTVNISLGSGAPSGAGIKSGKSQITLQRTDKDPNNFNFNYDKVQLPYYNEVGTGNCTKNKVVTGWKITSITATGEGAATQGTFTSSDTWGGYNFADRAHYAKDLYSESGRVFSQGAYFDVPDGVTAISIEPYWGTAAYLADEKYDSYGYETSKGVTDFGTHYTNNNSYNICGDNQKVYTSFGNALGNTTVPLNGSTVYDNAIVLVGNYHQKGTPSSGTKAFTIMSADLDEDNEPDYSFIYNSGKGEKIAPIRFDFVNVPGTAMAHKRTSSTYMGIMGNHKWKGWLEVTNTCFIRFSQLEYDDKDSKAANSPVILLGGVVEQIVSTNGANLPLTSTSYIHLGSNVWFKLFHNGCHLDKTAVSTPHIPISVTGGDFEKFYLSGYFKPDAATITDNAECYISGGRFDEVAGAGQEPIKGDVQWLIDHADITNFFGGGINDKKPIEGDITVTIKNSHVDTYCGGPKFGNMSSGKTVNTTATNCTFGTYFGAGYGGTAYYRYLWNPSGNKGHNKYDKVNYDWNGTDWLGNTANGFTATNRGKYDSNMGIAVNFEYEHFEGSNDKTVARLYVNYASLSIAETNDVTSTLTGCTVERNFYGGGSLGKVNGNATSTLANCTVNGSVFGAGYSASVPSATVYDAGGFTTIPNYNIYTGVFEAGVFPDQHEFIWEHKDVVNSKATAFNDDDHILYTQIDLNDLGTVAGNVTLNITGNTLVEGKIFDGNGVVTAQTGGVFGGGAQSEVTGADKTVQVNINQSAGDATHYINNVYGGGDQGDVASEVQVNIQGTSYVLHDVFGGGNLAKVAGSVKVEIDETASIQHNVYGGGNEADVLKTATVNMKAGSVLGSIYGGGNLGDVGRIDDKSNKRQYTWTGIDGNANSTEPYATNNSGVTYVNITGGTVGPATPTEALPGNVFGGGKGLANTFWCEKGMVYSTNVSISNGTVKGSVYGGGELGRVETDTKVTIGPASGEHHTEIIGNVFGAGKGVETHGYSALVRGNTEVIVQNGATVDQNVYGGGEIASVGKYNVDANGMPYSQANNTSGNCIVYIPGATQITGDIFGGGKGIEPEPAYLATETYTGDDKPKRMTLDGEGNSIWQEYENRTDYLIYLQTLALATQTKVEIDQNTSDEIVQSTKGNVYGGSENGIVQHSTSVIVSGKCKIGDDGNATSGNIYGGGKGLENVDGAGLVGEDATVTINSGTILGSVYGGGVLGATKGNVTVNINGGTVNHDVYGGGAYAHTNTSNWHLYVAVTEVPTNPKTSGLYERSFGGVYTLTEDTTPTANKTYYTKNDSPTWTDSEHKSGLNKTRLNLRGGTIVGDAYGGALGDATHSPKVYGDIQVDLNKETCTDGTTVTTKTSAEKGCVVNQVFGCNNAYGSPQGNVTVHVYGTQNKNASKANIGAKFVKDEYSSTAADLYTHLQDSILIAEALNETVSNEIKALTSSSEVSDLSSALSTLKTAISAHSQDDINAIRYDVQAVYGGGNKAAYEPAYPNEATTSKTQVIIEGCEYTSINDVYGGGNAAAVPSTEVTVNSAYEINYLFGGGNGKSTATFENPGADVGTHKVNVNNTLTETPYGTGIAKTKLLGGEIHVVYGGSNEKGNIVGGTSIEVNNESGACTLNIGQIYGAGNNAKMDGGTDIVMGCMPDGVIEEIYAGARNADVEGDVKLTITSGKFGRVFGGNKHGGLLKGSITVNIEETGGCAQPLIIGELYGGGNLADYSIYGYKNTGSEQAPVWEARVSANDSGTGPTTPYADPKLNIRAFTSIGAVYGGGYRAIMVANPTVDINVVKGSHATGTHATESHPAGTIANIPIQTKNGSGNIIDDGTVSLDYPAHEAGAIGTIGNVFGGGNLANLIGDVTVNIGTETELEFITTPSHLTAKDNGKYAVEGANITGTVYGGGNEANVTGNTQVNICAKYDETADEYRRVAPGTAGVTIDHDVFGAGKGKESDVTTALVSGNTTIVMMDGKVKQSVYGGGELSQVGGNTNITVMGGTIGKEMEGSTRYGGEKWGNIYGGGKGNTTNVRSGLVQGNTTITVKELVATAGNAEYYGVSAGTVVSSPTVLHNIYGGGAHGSVGTYDYASTAADAAINGYATFDSQSKPTTGVATINILGGTIGYDGHENGMVFGSSRGDIDAPNTIYDNVAWVYSTNVIIGGEGYNPQIKGSVYGSGENGHTYQNASVTIHSGKVGITETMSTDPDGEGGAKYPYRGNVYGGGCGTDKYYSSPSLITGTHTAHDGEGDKFNIKAGIVGGSTTVLIDGGHVVRDVYGAGSMGAVTGTTNVTIAGNAIIGAENSGGGYVFAAARGDQDNPDKATVGGTTLNINGGTIWESAFGGGQNGRVKGSVAVNVTGGEVKGDVYGGGALADTNTDNWVNNALTADGYHEVTGLTAGESFVQGLYTKSDVYTEVTGKDATAAANTTYYRYGTTYNTTLNLTGGVIGNAYGGGLGRLQYLTEGDNGYVSPIEAMVYGDVSVMVNGTAFTAENDNYSSYWKNDTEITESGIVPKTGRVFGCNNLNGTPKGNVTVSVRRTKRYDAALKKVVDGHEPNKFEIRGVYGGGNLANYVPVEGKKTSVDVHNCDETSIEKVYGGGNSANVPTTHVTIYGAFEIHYVFGGGNGADMVWKNNRWQENDGANVSGNASVVLKGGNISDAFIGSDTKGSVLNATANVDTSTGGDCKLKLTNFYGSSKRSDVFGDVNINVSSCSDDDIQNVYGGSYDAQIHGNITMTVTSGILKNVFGGNDRLGSIGGNITINIDEEDDCKPIIIQNLYGGGFNAPYPGAGATKYTGPANPTDSQKEDVTNFTSVTSGKITINVKSCTRIDNIFGGGVGETAVVTGETEVNVNMIKGSWANNPLPNLGTYTGQTPPNIHSGEAYVLVTNIKNGETNVKGYYTKSDVPNPETYTLITTDTYAAEGTAYYEKITSIINNDIGTIGNIYGGGDAGNVNGNSTVNIGTATKISHLVLQHDGSGNPVVDGDKKFVYDVVDNVDVIGATITGNVYGGGNVADVTGTSTVYICTADGSTSIASSVANGVTIDGDVFGGGCGLASDATKGVTEGNTYVYMGGGSIAHGSIYGGGSNAHVHSNTHVEMFGGYVFDGIYGGGLQGSVGTVTDWEAKNYDGTDHASHTGCVGGKPKTYADNTGKCTVIVRGGQVGPAEVATKGMKNVGGDGPVDVGFVFGAGRGEVENPDDDLDADFHTYVKETEVIIKNTYAAGYEGGATDSLSHVVSSPLIMASVYGGGENGRVKDNTLVKIYGGQIGCGVGKTQVVDGKTVPLPYTEDEWTGEDYTKFTECASWDYGKEVGGKTVYLPYDPLADLPYRDGTSATDGSTTASDGHTYYGCVFGGGSGYFPYEIKNALGEVIAHDWLRSAGLVEGNTKVLISGGHILTSVYGGNELTDVSGDCKVIMSGGTLGVPRDVDGAKGMKAHPVTCYLFGAGKGDQRTHFNTWTNVRSTIVEVSGTARIFGSVFGGGEDGHVTGNTEVNILDGGTIGEVNYPKIGTTGTSYVDGNVFGGGRGFSGEALTAGTIGGNATVNITGGTMLGSIYGGGRLASVGVDFTNNEQDPNKGQFNEDDDTNTYGHVTINISGGTIGNTTETIGNVGQAHDHDHTKGGNVFGGSMGRLTLLNDDPNVLWSRLAQVKTSSINITGGTINNSVYGGAEFGTTRDNVYVTIGGTRATNGVITPSGTPTIKGHVYGGGYGSSEQRAAYNSTITAGPTTYLFTPMQYAGIVGGNTYVNVVGSAHVNGNVYGGGEMASVGIIDYSVTEDEYGSLTYGDKKYKYVKAIKHGSADDVDLDKATTFYDFGLSWPYQFEYVKTLKDGENYTEGGKSTVNITGSAVVDNYVFGGGRGMVAFDDTGIIDQRYTEAHIANVRESEVIVGTANGSGITPTIRTVYGGGEDGHVNEDANITIHHGTIQRSVFGGGKGTTTFKSILLQSEGEHKGEPKADPEDVHSWTAGKVYGNTYVTMNGGSVGWFIYGGGNMASVGKGNYSGGADDYSTVGYGELPSASGNLWTTTSTKDLPWHFLNSGKTNVTILGGTVGATNAGYEYSVPKGSVFGGSRGQAAKSVNASPRYRYSPDFFMGYVNKATINIGGYIPDNATTPTLATTGPAIYGSVYGGGQDGHVRNGTEVKIFKGTINRQNVDEAQRSGNVFGAGSGIGTYTDGSNQYLNNSSGSVTCTTLVEVSGDPESTIINGNVYGGGALASVGPYKMGYNEYHATQDGHKSCSYTQVDIKGGTVKGSVFGASRGPSETFLSEAFQGGVYNPAPNTSAAADQYNPDKFATDIWSDVNIMGGVIEGNVYGGGEGGRVKESTSVKLTGGVIGTASAGGDVYGSGKGTEHLAANVGGNTSVELNPGKTLGSQTGCVVRRIFGCNDLNGTPLGHASVHVYATQHRDKTNIGDKYEKYEDVTKKTITEYDQYLTGTNGSSGLAATYGVTPATDYRTIINQTDIPNFSGTDEEKQKALDKLKREAIDELRGAISDKKYDVVAVYGGGNLAPYVPTAITELASVVIDGCELTSIRQVYGGGNAASTPANSLLVNGTYELDEVFGGGNGKDIYQDPRDGLWYQNPGANVGYKDFTHITTGTGTSASDPKLQVDYGESDGADKDASSPEKRKANYAYGSGVATTTVLGGHIHYVYGGSNKRGNICTEALSVYQEAGGCDLLVDEVTGAGKDAETDAEAVLQMDCVSNVENIYGGSTNADVYNNVTLTITNGNFKNVFGGNNTNGAIHGSITVNIEEGGCVPIHIDNLYAGGYLAPYSIYGYEETNAAGNTVPKLTGTNPKQDPCINVISASYIGNIFGGGYQATVVGNPHVNVNMTEGKVEVVNTAASGDPVWKDNQGKTGATIYTTNQAEVTEGTVYTKSITSETKYYVTVNAVRVEVQKVVLNDDLQTALTTQVGNDDTAYKETEGGKTYVYKNDDTFYIVTSVTPRTTYWAALPTGYINYNIYGGGNQAEIVGDTHVEIGTGTHHDMSNPSAAPTAWDPERKTADIRGSVFGGGLGENAYIQGNTYITMGDGATVGNNIYGGGELGSVGPFSTDNQHITYTFPSGKGICNVEITGGQVGPTEREPDMGHVFGGGKGKTTDTPYLCEEAMAYNTNVNITNGTVTGNVYGGGEVARLENNTVVTIGEAGSGTSAPVIKGNLYGGGKGLRTHGYSALARGDANVTIQGKARVEGSVYGGGEMASMGRYVVVGSLPTAPKSGGKCTIDIKDYAEIGHDGMKMYHGGVEGEKPDDWGHVFGGGRGTLPYDGYSASEKPWSILANGTKQYYTSSDGTATAASETAYFNYLKTLALASETDITIGGHAFVKGSVYGGSENGRVQADTHVTIQDYCQIGNGMVQMYDNGENDGKYLPTTTPMNRRYTEAEWAAGRLFVTDDPDFPTPLSETESTLRSAVGDNYQHSLPECSSWKYGKDTNSDGKKDLFAPYDKFANATGNLDKYDDNATDTHGGRREASDGHSFYGSVCGGGSGYYPYKPGKWHPEAGYVGGNTYVNINGGHILTNAYGGNEMSNVAGTCYVTMTGGTVGVPRTLGQIDAHPVTCYVFGGGMGESRDFFNSTQPDGNTPGSYGNVNVGNTVVEVRGGWVYGSVFGGAEDGHVLGDTKVTIKGTAVGSSMTPAEAYAAAFAGNVTKIGTWGTSYVDGNIFGGGRGFSGSNIQSGNVVGNATIDIEGGTILGSIYGGGRLASVGTDYSKTETPQNGFFQDEEAYTAETAKTHNAGLVGALNETTALTAAQAAAYNAAMSPATAKVEGNTLSAAEAADYNATLYGAVKAGDFNRTGHVTINIKGGVIGNDLEPITPEASNTPGSLSLPADVKDWTDANWTTWKEHNHIPKTTFDKETRLAKFAMGGKVYGGSMGRLTKLDGSFNENWPKVGQVKETHVNVTGGTIKRDVFGGGETGTVKGNTHVNISGGEIRLDVFGGGYGSDDNNDNHQTVLEVANPGPPASTMYFVYTPMMFAGCVGGNTYVNISDGKIGNNVYGGGEMASVGVIDYQAGRSDSEPYVYTYMSNVKHTDKTNSFALSWPWKVAYSSLLKGGSTYVTVTGGRIGSTNSTIVGKDNGNIYGGCQGKAGDPYKFAFCGNVKETYVTVNYTNGVPEHPEASDAQIIMGSIFGGGEDGHVIEDTHVSMQNGLIAHSLFAGGRGEGTYTGTLRKLTNGEEYTAPKIRSITAGKVYGNTYLEMTGGTVWHNVFGGGYMASVGKGNYSGGADDYATDGYGEKITTNLWTPTEGFKPRAAISDSNKPTSMADYFLSSGITYLTITGGTVGKLEADLWDGLPSGSVFGGSRGVSAPNIINFTKVSPEYCPEFFIGYVNETYMTIGGDYKCVKPISKGGEMYIPGRTISARQAALFTSAELDEYWAPLPGDGPKIYGSVYGGGQDGHVRREAHMIINKGEVGVPYTTDNKTALGTDNLDDHRWLLRGNLFGAGSGIGTYKFDLNGDGNITEDPVTVDGVTCKETSDDNFSTSAGSVTHFTVVDVYGGIVHRNIYGGGSLASVGPPPVGSANITRKGAPASYGTQSQCTVNIAGTIGTPDGYVSGFTYNPVYGGEVYGASRGEKALDPNQFGSVIWTQVNIKDGATIQGNVFGGGDAGMVKKDSEVNVGDKKVTP